MTREQIQTIIAMFNTAANDEVRTLRGMDEAKTDKAWSKYSSQNSFAQGRMSAIESMLVIFGYEAIKDDEEKMIDIKPL